MRVGPLAPGLWYWRAASGVPNSVYYEGPEHVVLIDPRCPPPGTPDAERFRRHLTADLDRVGRPLAVVSTRLPHHADARRIAGHYGGRLIGQVAECVEVLPGVVVHPVATAARIVALPGAGALALGETHLATESGGNGGDTPVTIVIPGRAEPHVIAGVALDHVIARILRSA